MFNVDIADVLVLCLLIWLLVLDQCSMFLLRVLVALLVAFTVSSSVSPPASATLVLLDVPRLLPRLVCGTCDCIAALLSSSLSDAESVPLRSDIIMATFAFRLALRPVTWVRS